MLLVLDATTGQNAIAQAKAFKEAINISGIILAKLDGTAKGGIIVAIKQSLDIPVKLIGLGEQVVLEDYSITYDSLAEFDTDDNRNVARAVVSVYEDGEKVGELYPRRDFFYESRQPMTIPGVRSTMGDDFYVLLVDWQPISTQRATFKLYHNPLVNWLWIGSFVLIIGTMVAAWPEEETEAVRAAARETRAAVSK